MVKSTKILMITALLLFIGALYADIDIYYQFANGQITNEGGSLYYEYDILVNASSSGSNYGYLQMFIVYNTLAFGENVANTNTVVTRWPLLTNAYLLSYRDSNSSMFAINIEQVGFPSVALPVEPTLLVHVKMLIADPAYTTGIAFYETYMEGEQFYDDFTQYNDVVVVNDLDQTLPVELSSFTATMNNSHTGVNLTWVTHSESNLVGYGIYRGESNDFDQATNLNAFIGATNTSQTQIYMFSDLEVYPEQTYWYWLESMEMNGINEYFGPIFVTIPQQPVQTPQIPLATALVSLYPNPFNPDLTINYSVDRTTPVNIVVTNLKGQIVRNLVNESKNAGLHTYKWDGRDNLGGQCASGLYLVRMQASGRSVSRKVMLMK